MIPLKQVLPEMLVPEINNRLMELERLIFQKIKELQDRIEELESE